jgi:serine/threonine protein kinase
MSNFPDFSQHGYQIISQLGENHLGGRVTYLAERQTSATQTDQVVIKQFQFALMGATWAEYDAYSQEITMLRQLNHPGIAKYIDAFQTPDGFCMVQEYLDAQSLATPRSWTPKQIKQIGLSVLEILVYLQSQNPPIIHRDIKP